MNETETFQHYQVLRRDDGSLWELGRGAMGVTYKAFDVNLRCHVALKVINGQFLDSETARARFLREARAAAGLRHRNVASVYHLGNDEASFFYSMEFIDGKTVEALVAEQGPLPAPLALGIVRQVARALGAASKQGVVHRDIKPANLMVVHEDDEEDEEGFVVKVIDFGLARSAMLGGEQSGQITMGGFVGTPQYASPEQIEEKDLDVRSDIYSLGVTLWYMLVGSPPFTGTVFRISSQHLSKEPPWSDIAANVPEAVRDLLARMLHKNPDDRPQTPGKLRAEIEECLRQLPSATGAPLASVARYTSGGDTLLPEEDTSAVATIIQGPAPSQGRIFAGRYQLAVLVHEGPGGQTFRAYDGRLDGKLVAVQVLPTELHLSPQTFYHLQGDLGRLRDAPHPQLIENYLLERVHGYKYRVMEWVNGYPLASVLASRGALPLKEALRLLGQAADAAAHGSLHRLHRLELSPDKILVNFADLNEEADPPTPESLANRPFEQWPRFCLKIDALNPTHEASRTTAKGSTPKTPVRDTLTSIRGLVEGSYFYALGALLREMLGGALSTSTPLADAPPLEALSEEGNAVLRQAFATNPGYATENEWFHAVLRSCGRRREDVGLSRATVEEAPRTVTRSAAATRPGTADSEARPPQGMARPAEARAPVRSNPPPPPARPTAPPAKRPEEEQTLTEDRAETLVPKEKPVPVVARPTPVTPVLLPVAPPPEPASVPEIQVINREPTGPPTVAGPPSKEADSTGNITLAPGASLAAAATHAPVEPSTPPPAAPARPEIAAPPKPERRFPLAPVLAVAALVVVGIGVALWPRSKAPDHPTRPETVEATPAPTAAPAIPVVQSTPIPTPPVEETPVAVAQTPPAATPVPSVPEATPVMEAVPDTPPPTPVESIAPAVTPALTPRAPAATPTPTVAALPKPVRPPSTPSRAATPKPTPRPRATPPPPIKGKPTPPPRNDEDVPAFMR